MISEVWDCHRLDTEFIRYKALLFELLIQTGLMVAIYSQDLLNVSNDMLGPVPNASHELPQ